ncbi:glycosyltransferase family 2 protein [bacterium]|nr:glycosyltransferase family 2 protein [bacterium]
MERLPLSVPLISFNEEENIGRTLESIKDIASEIVVVDSHSMDKTREIAKSYGAKVFKEDWKGYVNQKNSALEKCTREYVLSLDCDEVVSRELKDSIIDGFIKSLFC